MRVFAYHEQDGCIFCYRVREGCQHVVAHDVLSEGIVVKLGYRPWIFRTATCASSPWAQQADVVLLEAILQTERLGVFRIGGLRKDISCTVVIHTAEEAAAIGC